MENKLKPFSARFEMPAGITPTLAWLDFMQEAAGLHAEKLGMGISHLSKAGVTWVLMRYHVRFAAPRQCRAVVVTTWPSARRKLYAMRDFLMHDEDGNEVLRATSAWLLMHLDNRRPARPDTYLPDSGGFPERILDDDFAPLPEIAATGKARTYLVEPDAIDVNDHVNNLVYIDWAMKSAPAEWVCHRYPAVLEVAYLGEARLGDEVHCHSLPVAADDGVLLQRLQNGAGRELTRLRTIWRMGLAGMARF